MSTFSPLYSCLGVWEALTSWHGEDCAILGHRYGVLYQVPCSILIVIRSIEALKLMQYNINNKSLIHDKHNQFIDFTDMR